MRDSDSAANVQAATLRKVLRLLDGLNVTDTGRELFKQITRMLSDYEAATQETEQTLIASIGFLLDSISTHLSTDSNLLTQISLLRARLQPPIDYVELHALRRALEQCADTITLKDGINDLQVKKLLSPLLTAYGLRFPDRRGKSPSRDYKEGNNSDKVHYLQQMDVQNGNHVRSHRFKENTATKGIDIVMDSLNAHEKILEGLDKSKEFGKFLELELATIKHIDKVDEFDEKKSLLESELQNILRNHNQLIDYFQTVSSYLSLVQNEGQRLNDELNRVTTLSLTDDLTGLPNRRAFIKRMRDEISRAKRYGNSLALALVDLDGFKPINDNYGHPAGDAVLQAYSEDVLTTFRQNDMIARYGGEEFAVVFPNTSIHGAYKALEKVLKRANESKLQFEGNTIDLPSFSAGLVMFSSGEPLDTFIARADEMLYQAKKGGRNRIEMLVPESSILAE